MYALVDCLCTLAGIAGIVLCCVNKQPKYIPIPAAWLALYPVVNELIYNLVAGCCSRI